MFRASILYISCNSRFSNNLWNLDESEWIYMKTKEKDTSFRDYVIRLILTGCLVTVLIISTVYLVIWLLILYL